MTTSTSSASATGLPDRRHFLSTVAGVGAFVLPALPALAAAPGPIETMFAEYLRLEAIASAAASRAMDAEEHYEEPPRPTWHPITSSGGYEIVPTTKGRGFVYLDVGDENVAYLRAQAAQDYDLDDDSLDVYGAEKAKKTLAEIEVWQAEVRERKDAVGLTDAEAAERQAYAAANAHRTAMLLISATTIRELAHQAALFDDDWRQIEGERLVRRLAELAGVVRIARAEGNAHVADPHSSQPRRCRSSCRRRGRTAGGRRRLPF